MSIRVRTTIIFAFLFALAESFSSAFGAELDKASVSFRIGTSVWMDDARFAQLLDLFDKYPGATDEITFFTQSTHAPITDDELERRCEILKDRIAASKARGYRAGINILCTIGQHPEDMPRAIGPEIPRAVSLDGAVAQATLCMNTPEFRARVERIYSAMARTGADYIWIDDDVRSGHWLDSAGNGGALCYCDACLAKMTSAFVELGEFDGFDGTLTREFLRGHMSDPRVLKIVRDFYSDSIVALFQQIEETVHAVDSDVALGFMTGERYDEGYDFARWARALAGPDGRTDVYWRPGGGFYEQSNLYGGLFGKSSEIGRQVALLPPEVEVVQSEIENFPYQPLAKSPTITALEAIAHIGAGCSGVAFNVLTNNEEPLDDYEDFIAQAAERRPFFDLAVAALGRRPNVGVAPLWERTDAYYPERTPVQTLTLGFAEAGLPISYAPKGEGADVLLLSRAYLSHRTPEEAAALFEKGVYTDLNTINLANDPGSYALNDLTGMEYGDVVSVDGIERFESSFVNGEFAGRTRDLRQSFWREPIYVIHKTRPGVETASSAVDYSSAQVGETVVGLFENARGGRVCLSGYFPWSNFLGRPKQAQIRAIARWLSRDRLACYIDSFHRAELWAREPDASGATAILAINANYDDAKDFAIKIRTDSDSVVVYGLDCKPTEIRAESVDGPYRRFVVPKVGAWEPILVKVEKATF